MTATMEHVRDVVEPTRGIRSRELQDNRKIGFIPEGLEEIYRTPDILENFADAHKILKRNRRKPRPTSIGLTSLLTAERHENDGFSYDVRSIVTETERTANGYKGFSINHIQTPDGSYMEVHEFTRFDDFRDDVIDNVQPISERPDLINQCRVLINVAEQMSKRQGISFRMGGVALVG